MCGAHAMSPASSLALIKPLYLPFINGYFYCPPSLAQLSCYMNCCVGMNHEYGMSIGLSWDQLESTESWAHSLIGWRFRSKRSLRFLLIS